MNDEIGSPDRETIEAAARTAGWMSCVAQKLGFELRPGMRLLELGCGNGELVRAFRERGVEAFGCDLQFKPGPHTDALAEARLIATIERQPYRLPFADRSFDLIVSVSVLEHVMNVGETIREMARVTRPGGAGFHLFPSRYSPIEPHTYVPLGTVLRPRWWLRLCAGLGVRSTAQRDLRSAAVADANYRYLHESTNYLTRGAIRRAFGKDFDVRFCEDVFVGCAGGTRSHRLGIGKAMQRVRGLAFLYSTLRSRALWLRRT